MSARSRRAIPGLALLLALTLPAFAAAQRPGAQRPERTPPSAAQPPETTPPAAPQPAETTPTPAPAPAPAPAEAAPPAYENAPDTQVQTAERRRFDAMIKGDAVLVGRLLGEDLTYTHSTGEVNTKAQLLDSISSGKVRYLALNPDAVEVKVLGSAAVVTGKLDLRVTAGGKELAFPARYTSVYAKRHGHWLLVAWQSTQIAQP